MHKLYHCPTYRIGTVLACVIFIFKNWKHMHLESFKINHGVALLQQMPNCDKLHILLLNLSCIYNLRKNCVTPYGCIQLLILDTCISKVHKICTNNSKFGLRLVIVHFLNLTCLIKDKILELVVSFFP